MNKKTSLKNTIIAGVSSVIASSNYAHAAGLPKMEAPSRGTGDGIWDTMKNYAFDATMLVALLVIASMFIGVCYHAYVVYSEIQTGKKTWGQFGLTVAVGVLLLVMGIWLLTEATTIL